MGWFSLGKRWWRGDLIAVPSYLMADYKEGGGAWRQNKTQQTQAETQETPLDIKKNICIVRVVKHWSNLPREVGSLNPWRYSELKTDTALGTLLYLYLLLDNIQGSCPPLLILFPLFQCIPWVTLLYFIWNLKPFLDPCLETVQYLNSW